MSHESLRFDAVTSKQLGEVGIQALGEIVVPVVGRIVDGNGSRVGAGVAGLSRGPREGKSLRGCGGIDALRTAASIPTCAAAALGAELPMRSIALLPVGE